MVRLQLFPGKCIVSIVCVGTTYNVIVSQSFGPSSAAVDSPCSSQTALATRQLAMYVGIMASV